MRFLLFLFLMLIPFSYFEVLGVRVLLFQVFIGFSILIVRFLKIKRVVVLFDSSMVLLLFLSCVVLVFGLHSGYLNEFLAVSVFFILMLIVGQIDGRSLLEDAVLFYKYAVLFSAVGVFCQFLVHKALGVELFRYQLFGGGRNAYSFIWEDYSFLSLFIASAIPLFFNGKVGFKFLFVTFFLLVASIITSARTGVVAFSLFVALYVACELFRSVLSGRVNKTALFIFVFLAFLPPVMILGMENLTGRKVTLSSSGRIDDFVIGFEFFKERMWYGFLFDKELYNQTASMIPHNLFIYMLYMGGVVAFLVFILWLALVVIRVRFSDRTLLSSLLICFLGFQFIPSFFSAYFLAVLLGMAMLSSRVNRVENMGDMVKL